MHCMGAAHAPGEAAVVGMSQPGAEIAAPQHPGLAMPPPGSRGRVGESTGIGAFREGTGWAFNKSAQKTILKLLT
mgnify:CR=1 FL=1